MKISRITEAEVGERLDQPYNAPANADYDDAAASKAFSTEYFAVVTKVDSCLSKFGKRDDLGRGDYCLPLDWVFSRGIQITATKRGFVTASVLNALRQLLCKLDQDYDLYITHNKFEDMADEPYWHIFLNSKECSICAESLRLFPGLEHTW